MDGSRGRISLFFAAGSSLLRLIFRCRFRRGRERDRPPWWGLIPGDGVRRRCDGDLCLRGDGGVSCGLSRGRSSKDRDDDLDGSRLEGRLGGSGDESGSGTRTPLLPRDDSEREGFFFPIFIFVLLVVTKNMLADCFTTLSSRGIPL